MDCPTLSTAFWASSLDLLGLESSDLATDKRPEVKLTEQDMEKYWTLHEELLNVTDDNKRS